MLPHNISVYDGGPTIKYYSIYHCVIIAYSIQYRNMLYGL